MSKEKVNINEAVDGDLPLFGSFRLLNVFTGEVEELKYTNGDDLMRIYTELTTNAKAVKRVLEQIMLKFEAIMGDDEQAELGGRRLKRVQRELLEYQLEDIRKYLDEDQISLIMKPNVTALKAMVKEMVERNELPGGAWKDIEEHALRKPSKPYIKVD